MKKVFTLLLTVLVGTFAFAQQPSGVIMKASVAPLIDGDIDAVWADANVYEISQAYLTNVPTLGNPGETTWQALWTSEGIYVLIKVTDDAFYPYYAVTPAGATWAYDKPEIYFDVNYTLVDGIGPAAGQGHYQIAPSFTDGKNDGTLMVDAASGADYAFKVSDPDYVAEYFIPFSKLIDKDDIGIDLQGNIGFDISVIDRDPGDEGERIAVWANTGAAGSSWNNMDEAGIITFDGAEATVYIESIQLTGGTITSDNGSLQMGAAILPENATNKHLLWNVVNGTGKATIDESGLLTGVADGTVTVTANATDGSYEDASVEVTISGQHTTLWELNVIKNGKFDDVNIDGTAAIWDGPAQVIDGVSANTAPVCEFVWEYEFTQNNLQALPDVDYIYSFVAWADVDRRLNTDFEDTDANLYARYGTSPDPNTDGGTSDWTFDITTIPTKFVFHVNFDKILPTTDQKVCFFLGAQAVESTVYVDSVLLVTAEEAVTYAPNSVKQLTPSTVKLYPNPMDNSNLLRVTLPSSNTRVAIFDCAGRKVEDVVAKGNRVTFDVSRYASGIYFVKADDTVVKFIK